MSWRGSRTGLAQKLWKQFTAERKRVMIFFMEETLVNSVRSEPSFCTGAIFSRNRYTLKNCPIRTCTYRKEFEKLPPLIMIFEAKRQRRRVKKRREQKYDREKQQNFLLTTNESKHPAQRNQSISIETSYCSVLRCVKKQEHKQTTSTLRTSN